MNNMSLKNKIVLIHIDSIRREYLSSWLLAEKFKEKGYNVLLSSRHSTGRLLKLFTPSVFISTHAFTIKFKNLYRLKKGEQKFILMKLRVLIMNMVYPQHILKFFVEKK